MPPLSDLDHYKIETQILGDGNEVVNYEYVTNVRLRLRNAKFERRWYRQAKLGQGSSSNVWLEVQRDNPGATRAVKAISKRKLLENNVDYTRELKALTEFSKPKYCQKGLFVDFLGWWDNPDCIYLAMEYFPLGNLEDNIISGHPDVPGATDIMIQLVEGLEIMHAEGFAHRDLKPANLFVVQKDPNWWVKIGDFGISKRIQNQDTSLRTFTGTHDYMAPEFFGYGDDVDEERSDYTHAVDLWALGCVSYRLYTGKVPFPSNLNLRPLQRYCSGQTACPKEALQSSGCDEIVVGLIMGLLDPRPSQRPSAKDLLATLGPIKPLGEAESLHRNLTQPLLPVWTNHNELSCMYPTPQTTNQNLQIRSTTPYTNYYESPPLLATQPPHESPSRYSPGLATCFTSVNPGYLQPSWRTKFVPWNPDTDFPDAITLTSEFIPSNRKDS